MEPDQTIDTKFIDAPRGRIAYVEAGEGPAVILLHGGGPGAYGYSNFWKNMQPLADRGNRVIVIDLPGYGQSDFRQSEGGLFAPMAEATLDVIEHFGLEKASLVGNSLGGGTALRLALDHPEKVDRLILMGPGGSLPSTSIFPTEGLVRMLTFYDGTGPSVEKLDAVIDHLVYDRSSITPELVQERFRVATLPQTMEHPPLKGAGGNPRNDLWREPLETLTHKTLLIWGREDRIMPMDMAFILLKRIANADLHLFAKCGHWAQWERAEEFNVLVGQFLAQTQES